MRKVVDFINGHRLIAATAALILIGGVALAVIIGQARINQNTAQSGDIVPELTTIGVALVTNQTCFDSSVAYQEISPIALFNDAQLNFDNFILATATPVVCIKNFSSSDVQVQAALENVVSGELSPCPDQYELSVGDASCGATEGELAGGELLVHLTDNVGLGHGGIGSTGCFDGTELQLVEGALNWVAVLSPTHTCAFNLDLRKNPNVFSFVASSTDTIEFDIVFNADDFA